MSSTRITLDLMRCPPIRLIAGRREQTLLSVYASLQSLKTILLVRSRQSLLSRSLHLSHAGAPRPHTFVEPVLVIKGTLAAARTQAVTQRPQRRRTQRRPYGSRHEGPRSPSL